MKWLGHVAGQCDKINEHRGLGKTLKKRGTWNTKPY